MSSRIVPQNSTTSVAGKKRKKKKKEEPSTKHQVSSELPKVSVKGRVSMLPLQKVTSLHMTEEICSSSSSIEKARKLGRFDCYSSDAMSVGCTSSSAAMDSSTASYVSNTSKVHTMLTTSIAPNVTSQKSIHRDETPDQHSNLNADLSCESSNPAVHNPVECGDSGVPTNVVGSVSESLRWDKVCSDEEQEQERISLYKANRRKRYENALSEKKTKLNFNNKTGLYYGYTASSPPAEV